MSRSGGNFEKQIEDKFGLRGVECEFLTTPTNDVVEVSTPTDRFALKLYSVKARNAVEVQWEIDLVTHLIDGGAPVVQPVRARDGYVQTFPRDGMDRVGVLFEWAPGAKPTPSVDTYVLLGEAAARIHKAADTFISPLQRERYDASVLIDEQLVLMRNHLVAAGRLEHVARLGDRLKRVIDNPELDRGICHMDLTLDNVHRTDNSIIVFDFDSAGECWRALEPHGVLRFSSTYFEAWLEGYRSVREFNLANERAVSAFTVIGDLRCVAWKLGVARSSRGEPLLDVTGLADVVDEWLALE